ncbi:TPA: caspase family protein [Citrobacter freundii]|uniref:caspase family protein n=1 Tax=Citrobacter freundii TaxID=546 RepID=UPI001A2BDC9C|nr:caspase family protein [Citrobacter freundii]HAT4042251.1 caspase family protein [Citrobacter freundii]HAT4051853.1 caspase family protein [Citrobacter freundii]HAT4055991.1 caspase family protein [Citrobacter freundii]HAT4065910.1 caspase family protein [Citrobacter freundii]
MTALVIGNSKYPGSELKNATNDSEDITNKLSEFGFSVIHIANAKKRDIDEAVNSFRDNLNSNDVGLFYFAGHGMQIDGENYINAVDTDFNCEIDAKYSSYPLNKIIETMERSKNKTNIIILDACRNNPYERAWDRGPAQKGLAPLFAPKGTIIAYATSPGEIAGDGKGRNGCYTEALLKHITTPDIPIEEMFKRVRNSLAVITKNKQTSWEHTSLAGDFFFNISLVTSIGKYEKESIVDQLFHIKPHDELHSVISKLKSHDWYTQTPAARGISSKEINSSDIDSAFIFGRNIYQASCGSAHGATEFIMNFRDRTKDVKEELKISILDGMLFEIFFNSKGEIRDRFKSSKFNAVFDYQQYPEFDESFKFISDILAIYPNRFHIIPGKNRDVSIDIETKGNKLGERVVTGVYLGGLDILRENEDYFLYETDGKVPYEALIKPAFEKRVSDETLIPSHNLTINFDFEADKKSKILFPYGHTLAK